MAPGAGFADADETLVGRDPNEQPVAPVDPDLEGVDRRDAHAPPMIIGARNANLGAMNRFI